MKKIDLFDKEIVRTLQQDARISNIQIAEKIGVSHTTCSRRIAKLEQQGIILGYHAATDRHKLGFTVRAFCGIVRNAEVELSQLAQELSGIEGVVSVFAVSGEADLMLEIFAKDMHHYSQVVLKSVQNIKGVNATRSSFVLDEIKTIY